MVQQVDVLICGSGSAGLCAAAWLARYGIRAKILEKRDGPMEMGQADGVQCRTVEVFDSFGLAEDLLKEAYHVVEVAFWIPDGKGGIHRKSTTPDTPPGLSHQPHVILNQARLNGLLIEEMQRSNGQEIDYNYTVRSVKVDSEAAKDPEAYPVTVVAEKDGAEEEFKARYVLGCDGAHSVVRKSLGYTMVGDSTDAVWGVMDVYPRTNFPDIRKKCSLQTEAGNLLIIPREGGSLVRFYIELPSGVVAKDVKLEDLHAQARRIFAPYTMEISDTFWWSAYAIGQRRADFFTKDHRVFLTGDACHTHSPKAGQGMNVSLQDGYNIGWKLGYVLRGQAPPSLLETYILEREKVATDLIEFDRYFTRLFSSKYRKEHGVSGEQFSDGFVKSLRYTAGLTAKYDESPIIAGKRSSPDLAKKVTIGMRFPSTQVVRFCDARPVQLMTALHADCRWRVVIFAGDIRDPEAAGRLEKIAKYLEGLAETFTSPGAAIDSFIEPIVVLSGKRLGLEQEQIPEYFWPPTGKWKMRDLHKVYVDDEAYNLTHGHAYKFYDVDVKQGAVVVVRPDQYVSQISAVDDFEALGEFFRGFALPQR